MFCLERLVLFEPSFVSFPQSYLLYTPFERAIHDLEFDRILYVFTYIFSFNKKKSRIAFAMLILQVYMLLFKNRKFTAVAKIP